MAKLWERFTDRIHLCKHGIVLNKRDLHIGMIQNIGNLLFRDIGGAGYIGGTAKLNGGIGQNPLEAIV